MFGAMEKTEYHKNEQFLTRECILAGINSQVITLQSELNLNPDQCLILLVKFKWSTKPILEALDFDPESFLVNNGVLPEQIAIEPMECSVCYADEHFLSLTCGHLACRDCWQSYLFGKLEEGKCLIECMNSDCHLAVDKLFIENFGSTLSTPYQTILVNDYVQAIPTLSKCPGSECTLYFQSSSSLPQTVTCSCGSKFCSSCESTPHSPATCRQWQLWQKKCETSARGASSTDRSSQEWFLLNTKKCPRCLTSIQKNGGCRTICCSNNTCHHQFCWMCRRAMNNHGVFCDKSHLEAERVRIHKRSSSQRFHVYYTKFNEHQSKLELELEQKTLTDVEFIEDMGSFFLESRRILMHSCVFEYYLALGRYSEQLKKQKVELEEAMMRLSRSTTLENYHLLKSQLRLFLKFCENGAAHEDLDGRSHSDSLIWNQNFTSKIYEFIFTVLFIMLFFHLLNHHFDLKCNLFSNCK